MPQTPPELPGRTPEEVVSQTIEEFYHHNGCIIQGDFDRVAAAVMTALRSEKIRQDGAASAMNMQQAAIKAEFARIRKTVATIAIDPAVMEPLLKAAPILSGQFPPQPAAIRPGGGRPVVLDTAPLVEAVEDVTAALALCESIIEDVQSLPDKATDFGISVLEKTEDIQATIEERNHVTDGQFQALENMHGGVLAWLR